LFAPSPIVAGGFKLIDQFVYDVVFDRHAIGSQIAVLAAIEVDLAHIQRVLAQLHGDIVHDILDGQYALRPAKAAKSRVGLRVGPHTQGADIEGIQEISIVGMKDLPVSHRTRQVGRVAAAQLVLELDAGNQAVVGIGDLVASAEI